PLRGLTITIDPGIPPAGATGPTGLYEGDGVLQVGFRVRDLLTQRGANAGMTLTTPDPVDLSPRAITSRRPSAHACGSSHRIAGSKAVRSAALVAALLFGAARVASAQLPPNEHWRTLHTRHFRIHFTPPIEDEARRAAVNAERAYAELSRELVPPRGIIDLVVADNVDYVNGYATPFPSNRIVVYAHPPTDASGLRNYDDWNALVVTHELTHIFHLDRSRGIWRIGQAIFGRNP